MYLNEKAWEIPQKDPYKVDHSMRNFLDIYAAVKSICPGMEVYIPEGEEIYLRPECFPLEKWMASADIEYRRLYLLLRQKCIRYCPEDEYEILAEGEILKGGTEAYLNQSFMVSICLDAQWEREQIEGILYSLENGEKSVTIENVYRKEQLQGGYFKAVFDNENAVKVRSYEDLWTRRELLFPHLQFCPSVKSDLNILEGFYLKQVVKKLAELERYCVEHMEERFQPGLLSKTTPENRETIEKYRENHTFKDEHGVAYTASWHMRFTGIPGRIFFIPDYSADHMLVCYIGKKLPNVLYPT